MRVTHGGEVGTPPEPPARRSPLASWLEKFRRDPTVVAAGGTRTLTFELPGGAERSFHFGRDVALEAALRESLAHLRQEGVPVDETSLEVVQAGESP